MKDVALWHRCFARSWRLCWVGERSDRSSEQRGWSRRPRLRNHPNASHGRRIEDAKGDEHVGGGEKLLAEVAANPLGTELRILSSKEFDARSLLCVVFAGDRRLLDRLGHRDLQPIESRIRRRLLLEGAPRDEMLACLDHPLMQLATPISHRHRREGRHRRALRSQLPQQMTHCDELFATMLDRDATIIDADLFFDHYKPKRAKRRKKLTLNSRDQATIKIA